MIILTVFVCLASYKLDDVGLYYDEVLFVNAAIGAPADMFIHKKVFGIPVMLMPYIGALKAWIHYPIFDIFGVNVYSVRLPSIFIVAAALVLHFRFVQIFFGTTAAVIFLSLAVVDPSTVFHARFDWGPTALMMFFRGLLLFAFASWYQTKSSKYLIIGLIACVLGIFDKLNFIWIVNSVIGAAIIIYGREILSEIKLRLEGRSRQLLIPGIIVLICIVVFAVFFLRNIGLDEIQFQNFQYFKFIIGTTMSGEGVYSVITGNSPDGANLSLNILFWAFIVSFVPVIWLILKDKKRKEIIFLVLFCLLLLIQIFVTKQATGPHHTATLAPFWLVFIAVGLSQMLSVTSKRLFGSLVRIFAIVPICAILYTSIYVDLGYVRGLSGVLKPNWSRESYELAQQIRELKPNKIITVDWGISTIVHGLNNGKIDVVDAWPVFKDNTVSEEARQFMDTNVKPGVLFIVPDIDKATFRETIVSFERIINDLKLPLKSSHIVSDELGNPHYELFIYGTENRR